MLQIAANDHKRYELNKIIFEILLKYTRIFHDTTFINQNNSTRLSFVIYIIHYSLYFNLFTSFIIIIQLNFDSVTVIIFEEDT